MEKKGLCDTCENDLDCTFPRKFPVSECEEFDNRQPTHKKRKRSTSNM
jgi:hypothetical protein